MAIIDTSQRVKVAGHLAENTGSKVIGMIPALTAEAYKLEIITQYTHDGNQLKEPCVITFAGELTVGRLDAKQFQGRKPSGVKAGHKPVPVRNQTRLYQGNVKRALPPMKRLLGMSRKKPPIGAADMPDMRADIILPEEFCQAHL